MTGLILLLPKGPRTREFLAQAEESLQTVAPVSGPRALERLRAGLEPDGSAIVVL